MLSPGPTQGNPITYGFVLYGDITETEHRLRRSQLALHVIDGDPFPDGVYRPPSNSNGRCKPDKTLPRFAEDDYDPGGGGPGGTGDSGKTNLDPNCREGETTALTPLTWRRQSAREPGEQNEDEQQMTQCIVETSTTLYIDFIIALSIAGLCFISWPLSKGYHAPG